MDKKISISQLKEVAQEAYEQVKGNTGGKNADYIPYPLPTSTRICSASASV